MTQPYYQDEHVTVLHGDCLDILRELPGASVHSVVTDPPYELGFMGKGWDASGIAYNVDLWRECLRVLKPGGHLLAFGGSRTWHRLACAVEDAGFEIRDSIAWVHGQGFPKSLDVAKAITGAETGYGSNSSAIRRATMGEEYAPSGVRGNRDGVTRRSDTGMAGRDLPLTENAARWQGWGTALKPAFEPIVVARKPLAGTVAANVLAHGTGALNVDACRVAMTDADAAAINAKHAGMDPDAYERRPGDALHLSTDPMPLVRARAHDAGRWPTNVVLDDATAAELDRQSGTSVSRVGKPRGAANGDGWGMTATGAEYDDAGGASRFFPTFRHDPDEEYPCSISSDATSTDTSGSITAAPSEAGESSSAGPVGRLTSTRFRYEAKAPTAERPKYWAHDCDCPHDEAMRPGGTCETCGAPGKLIAHPTVKPLDLMRWLVRLVTPPGGTVLEPFAGSGTTAEACVIEGFRCIAIEREADYLPLIVARLTKPIQVALDLDGGAA